MKKYAPRKVFVLENGEYKEITYEKLCQREESEPSYKNKLFLPMYGMIMEVSNATYFEFYRMQRRQKYIDERSKENKDISYNLLTTDEFNGEDILIGESEDVAEQVIRKLMVDKLNHAMLLLSEDEQLLIYRYYYAGIPETELAAIYDISQQAVSKKIAKIRAKLKNLIEN